MLNHELAQLFPAGDVLLQGLLLEFCDELGRRRHPDVGGDQDLLDPLPKLFILRVPELSNCRVELPHERLPAPRHSSPQPPEPPGRLLLIRVRSRGWSLLDLARLRKRRLYLARTRLFNLRD